MTRMKKIRVCSGELLCPIFSLRLLEQKQKEKKNEIFRSLFLFCDEGVRTLFFVE
jgi:hypothetical protein